ncbi:hypothetical protein CRX72_07475 [Pantoea sp. BRM17]|nr:hypothetical protein CRX72_07475 [Pantoea sp. BRM17]
MTGLDRPVAAFLDRHTEVHNFIYLNTLIRRYSDTRRLHPLSSKNLSLESAIDEENDLLEPLRSRADLIIDTSEMSVHELAEMLRTRLLGTMGFYCVDNLPVVLLPELANTLTERNISAAVSIDVRNMPESQEVFELALNNLPDSFSPQLLFLDADLPSPACGPE